MTLLYGALYGLLVSEDNALVMGSSLLFVLLAAAMWITRNFDWYQLAPRVGTAAAQD
jgi:inner membrane protein